METRIVKLKSDFNNIITIRNTVKNVFDVLQLRINKLKLFYSEFIKNHKNDMFIFGLDSFRFQSKLIDIEYDDMKRLFLVINNRMYCEYFKLHKIIVEYILANIDDKKITDVVKASNYPIYKDLEPYKEYKFEIILDIHENILYLLNILMSNLSNKENELDIHKTKQSIGLNIDNFITTFNFNVVVLREKILMFINYNDFFHKMHTKYLKRFSNKIQLMNTHINTDIKFDEYIDKKDMCDNENYDIKNIQMNSDFTSLSDELYDELEGNLTTPSIVRSRNNSQPDLKRNFKEIIRENVSKATNMFQIFKPKINKNIEPKLSNEELNNIFTNIDTNCDNVIKENIGMFITEVKEDQEEEEVKEDQEQLKENQEEVNELEEEVSELEEEVRELEEEVKEDQEEEVKEDQEEPEPEPEAEEFGSATPVPWTFSNVDKKKRKPRKPKVN